MGRETLMEKRLITYAQYGSLLDELVWLIETSSIVKDLKNVLGLERGGLSIAVHLAHHLKLHYVDEHTFSVSPDYYIHNTLVVDDISHTGITLERFCEFYPTATLFYKKESTVKPTFYVETTDKWIVFPWERLDEIPNRN
jgi:hypoxanthine phosphoribosyltransferase